MTISVEVTNNNITQALALFKKKVTDLGLMKELNEREFYEKPTAKRKRKKNAAIRRKKAEVRMELEAMTPPWKHRS